MVPPLLPYQVQVVIRPRDGTENDAFPPMFTFTYSICSWLLPLCPKTWWTYIFIFNTLNGSYISGQWCVLLTCSPCGFCFCFALLCSRSYLSKVTGDPFFNDIAQRASDAIERARHRLDWALKNEGQKQVPLLLRGTIVNRTYGTHKNLYVSPFLLTIFGPVNYGPP